jgi:hypothetical protein
MTQLRPTKTVYTVSQFLEWQRSGILQLKPVFQRRSTWNSKAKSLLVDTVARGLPVPLVFLRQIQDLKTYRTILEVVDGQQRLRALLSFVDPVSLGDYNADRDGFMVRRIHNPALADRPFAALPDEVKSDILQYQISTEVFPPSTGDDVVLLIFSRLNSTGIDLNYQELRNARYFGAMKTIVYDIASRHVERWRSWKIFSDEDIAKMQDAEAVSEYLLVMMIGVDGKSQAKLNRAYRDYDDGLEGGDDWSRRFDDVLDAIAESVGELLPRTRIRRQVLFYSLFGAYYDHMFGLGSPPSSSRRARQIPGGIQDRFLALNEAVSGHALSDEEQDAMDRGTADTRRRQVRHRLFMAQLGLEHRN